MIEIFNVYKQKPKERINKSFVSTRNKQRCTLYDLNLHHRNVKNKEMCVNKEWFIVFVCK